MAGGRDAPIQLLVDGSNNNTALIALGYISQAHPEDSSDDMLAERLGTARAGAAAAFPTVDPRMRVWYNPELKSTNFIVPGLIAVVMMVMSAMLTSLTVAREWENGTMEQLIAGPVRPHEIVIGKLIPYFVLGLAQVILIVLTGTIRLRRAAPRELSSPCSRSRRSSSSAAWASGSCSRSPPSPSSWPIPCPS